MDADEISMVHPGFPEPKHVRLWVDGGWLRRESRTGADGAPRRSGKDLGSAQEARQAMAKERRKRMHDGFVLLRDRAEAAFGEPVLVCAAPNRDSSQALDLHPEGHTLVVGTMLKEAYGAEIHLIDVASGARRRVHTEPAGERQTFLHTVRFDAGGRGVVYVVNEETRRLDLDTGASRTLASYERWKTADFNPHCVRPSWDRARRRLLVFDAGNRVRVLDGALDAAGEPVLEVDVARRPECRAGALSPSGRLLALAFGTDCPDVEVWDVGSGRRVHRRRFPFPFLPDRSSVGWGVDSVGFDPTERYLIADGGFAEGPFSMELDTGQLAWGVPDSHRTDRWGTCYGWGFSPDGSLIAVGDRGRVCLRDAATAAEAPVQPPFLGTGRTYRVVFSDAGDLLACGGDSGSVVVLRMDGGT